MRPKVNPYDAPTIDEGTIEKREANEQGVRTSLGAVKWDFFRLVKLALKRQRGSSSLDTRKVSLCGYRVSTVVHPNSAFRMQWDLLSICLLLYTAIFTPFQIAFLSEAHTFTKIEDWAVAFAFDRFVDLVFIIDIFINFRSAWITESGEVYFNQGRCAKDYLESWFLLDFVSVLPWDTLILLMPRDSNNSSLRMPKLLRLFRLVKIFKVLRASRIFRRWESKVAVKQGVVKLSKFAFTVIIFAHWMGCLWFIVGTFGEEGDENYRSWVTLRGVWNVSWGEQYAISLYWALMTITTIGYGDVVGETVLEISFNTVAMFLGAAYYAYVVGTMCSLVQGLDVNNILFYQRIDAINEYMKLRNIPNAMRIRIRRYCFFSRESNKLANEQQILSHLSPTLRQEILLLMYTKSIHAIPYFRRVPPKFLANLAVRFHCAVYGPEEIIVREGDSGDTLHIVNKGRVRLSKKDRNGMTERCIAVMYTQDYFGERTLLFGAPRTATATTLTYTETSFLTKMSCDGVLDAFPPVKRQVRKMAIRHTWRRIAKEGYLIEAAQRMAEAAAHRQPVGKGGVMQGRAIDSVNKTTIVESMQGPSTSLIQPFSSENDSGAKLAESPCTKLAPSTSGESGAHSQRRSSTIINSRDSSSSHELEMLVFDPQVEMMKHLRTNSKMIKECMEASQNTAKEFHDINWRMSDLDKRFSAIEELLMGQSQCQQNSTKKQQQSRWKMPPALTLVLNKPKKVNVDETSF